MYFFPDGYLNENLLNKKFFKYKKSIGYKLTKLEPKLLPEKLHSLRNKYNFSFLSELDDKQISKITNLDYDDLKNAKKRLFTNPIYWNDSKEKIIKFKSELNFLKEDFCLLEGGRFLHISDDYNKGSALKKFLSIIEKSCSSKFTTVSLGDSENDLSMLESTDYSCIVKGENRKLSLKKKITFIIVKQKLLKAGKSLWNMFSKWRSIISDFYQNGIVATLHNFSNRSYEDLEKELINFSKFRPITLILPSLYSELEGNALPNIINEISKVRFLKNIVIGLDKATEKEFKDAKIFFSKLPQKHEILWNDGPGLKKLDSQLSEQNLAPQEMGKGRNVWYCMGYILALGDSEAIALHDCDILTYDKNLLARLVYPVANPRFNFDFCKGYYPRVSKTKVRGRVARLFSDTSPESIRKNNWV